jgi:hypothetical protein
MSWTKFSDKQIFPTYDYSQTRKPSTEAVCDSESKECFAVFAGDDGWKFIKACESTKLTFHFKSGYCLCKDDITNLFYGTDCKPPTGVTTQESSDIFNHFYQQQRARNLKNDSSAEVKQSFANLNILRNNTNNSEVEPDISFENEDFKTDETKIGLEMSLDEDSTGTTSQFTIYIAK